MRKSKIAGRIFYGIIAFALMLTGCAGKKSQTSEHFGTDVSHPCFDGPADFAGSLDRVVKIFVFGKYDGEKVLKPWIDTDGWLTPAFREQLCLVVTMNNHCVG